MSRLPGAMVHTTSLSQLRVCTMQNEKFRPKAREIEGLNPGSRGMIISRGCQSLDIVDKNINHNKLIDKNNSPIRFINQQVIIIYYCTYYYGMIS
jgi:hypothetical protein